MANKTQQEMASKIHDHKMKMEAVMSKAKTMEEEKRQATQQYDLKNKRGLTSQNQANPNLTAQKAKPPVANQSGRAIFKSKAAMAAEAEARIFGGGAPDGGSNNMDGSDTFLTDLMHGKKMKQ